tara:strand:+ start:2779 stop:3723 length:945 start_codon:yes stop_codon:yes gene_type:complete
MSQISSSEHVNLKSFHLAGIIPVAGQPLDFQFPWHDCLVPISSNFLAIERAVLECATAGCETIWIVCPSNMQPLLKHRLGEVVQDPVWISRKMDAFPSESRREIPIYYVEVHPRDQDKRDCMAWSILYGAKVAKKVCNTLSQWVTPNKYYVAFPYAVYPSQHLRRYRSEISNHGTFFILTDNGGSVLDGEYAGFAFDSKEIGKLTKYFWDKQTGKYDPSQPIEDRRDGKYITKLLPKEDRYSGRYFEVKDVFKHLDLTEKAFKVEMEWYYDISSWENLCEYLASDESRKMKKPKLSYLKYRTWNKVGEDDPETI